MDAASAESKAGLEEQLRNMILSNVTIANPPTNNPTSPRGHHQQNRRNQHNSPAAGRGSAGIGVKPRPNPTFKAPVQNGPPNQAPQGVPGSSAGPQGPRILQRPLNQNSHVNKGTGSSQAQDGQRQGRFRAHPHQNNQIPENPRIQVNYLDHLASQEIPKVEITMNELQEKEDFRVRLETICKKAVEKDYAGDLATLSLVGFGSLASGFATPGSDMDLAIVATWKNPPVTRVEMDPEIPRLLEKAVLESKLGARLLTRTRVPILKICQHPTDELYNALFEEREKWDQLPEEEKYPSPEPMPPSNPLTELDANFKAPERKDQGSQASKNASVDISALSKTQANDLKSPRSNKEGSAAQDANNETTGKQEGKKHPHEKPWAREKVLGPLDFPKSGVGIQCDINFSNPLGLHNTHLLRCYSLCDPRVRPMVLFVKAWAKRRKINSSYSGTLSSYGWVLMVLHYLVNIANPPVCPNLQLAWRPPPNLSLAELERLMQETNVASYAVRFWRNEAEIISAAQSRQLTRNTASIGTLLRGFFHYYASPSQGYVYGPRPPSFYWTHEVLSLRTQYGIRSKQEKGWTGAKTVIMAGKEIRHRYLFAIEDPFELDHNVARTVTHNGIVAIRDEFRRAWRIVSAVGKDMEPEV
ncbi:hypothetical protein BCR34DRAFT_672603 [Clohesyomyces aquaticus]|uniref:polynucleotide adenylyltransferase n=1 Tax=Clohesyomyces aquaticus TaxID=1231657 RepID=A0A1Y1ZX17_9PLEO|nr:hypothetical protein BCR34DRAFT_672603 [Clohesyomyces aquaticus]